MESLGLFQKILFIKPSLRFVIETLLIYRATKAYHAGTLLSTENNITDATVILIDLNRYVLKINFYR